MLKKTMARVYHVLVRNLATVSKENKRSTSQQTPISIVEIVHRFHGKTRIFLFFVRNRGWLKHIHSLYFVGQRTGPGNEHNKTQCLPISRDSDVTSFLTAGSDGRPKIWLMKNEGHRPLDNNEVSRALPFYALRSLVASQPPSFARYDTNPLKPFTPTHICKSFALCYIRTFM